MASPRSYATPVSDLTSRILDPVLRKRAGMSIGLVQSWEEIVGPRLARRSRPEKIQWPKRMTDADPFEPATLVIACEGAAALHLQHETGEVIARVNAFLGFGAVGRVKIVQKPVDDPVKPRRAPRPLSREQSETLADTVGGVGDDGLRQALERLGASILGTRDQTG